MPQFDFFVWFSLSLWTVVSFHIFYFCLLYYVIAPFANLQKTLIKLYYSYNNRKLDTSIFNNFHNLYFQKIKKENREPSLLLTVSSKITTNKIKKSNIKAIVKKNFNFLKKKIINNNLRKIFLLKKLQKITKSFQTSTLIISSRKLKIKSRKKAKKKKKKKRTRVKKKLA